MHLKVKRRTAANTPIHPIQCSLQSVVDTTTGLTMGVNHCSVQRSDVNPDLYLATILDRDVAVDTVFFELSALQRAFMTQLDRQRGIVLEYSDEFRQALIDHNIEMYETYGDDFSAYVNISDIHYPQVPTVRYIQLSWDPVVFVEPLAL